MKIASPTTYKHVSWKSQVKMKRVVCCYSFIFCCCAVDFFNVIHHTWVISLLMLFLLYLQDIYLYEAESKWVRMRDKKQIQRHSVKEKNTKKYINNEQHSLLFNQFNLTV